MDALCFRFAGKQFRFALDYDHPPSINLGHFFHLYQVHQASGSFDGDYVVSDEQISIQRPPSPEILFEYSWFFFVAQAPESGRILMGTCSVPGSPWILQADLAPDFSSGTIYLKREANGELAENFLDFPLRDHLMLNRLSSLDIPVCHASHVDYEGRSLIFMGPSGMGKSTAAWQWDAAGHRLLNDERNAMFVNDTGVAMAATTPWRGSHPETEIACQPLAAIFLLAQAPENRLVRVSPIRAISRLSANTFSFHYHKDLFQRILGAFGEIAARVPVYELHCTPDQRQVEAVKRTLAGKSSAG